MSTMTDLRAQVVDDIAKLQAILALIDGDLPRAKSKASKAPAGRLPRRSIDELNSVLDSVVKTLSKHPSGLRSEQIQKETGLEQKALVRVLSLGLETKRLAKTGQKRATTYRVKGRK